MAKRSIFVLGVSGGIGQSWHTSLVVEAVLAAAREQDGVETQLLDLSREPVEFAANKPIAEYNASTQRAVELAGRADAFVFASPIYRASYTGILKNFFDLLPVEALVGKVAGLVATGASQHHYLALDLIFRPVLTFFNMHSVPGVVYASREQFSHDRQLDEALRKQTIELGRDLVHMARQLSGQAWGPASPGVASIVKPPPW